MCVEKNKEKEKGRQLGGKRKPERERKSSGDKKNSKKFYDGIAQTLQPNCPK